MVNIETRQNGKFKLGYPYNNNVDNYFKSLSDDFITNYGLTTNEVKNINDHKNATLQFDKELHNFINELSIFKKEFETEGLVIRNKFDSLKETYDNLKEKLEILIKEVDYHKTEFTYASDNIEILKTDLEKVNEMILFYESQLIDETFVYSENYITETEERLKLIDEVINQNNDENDYYFDLIKNKIRSYTETLDTLKPYGGFKEVSLRNHYEAWQKRPEVYYTSLVECFSDEYNSFWTYGKSLMYSKKKNISDAKKKEVELVYEEWKQTLIKKYEFKFEKELKTYSLLWLNKRDTFEMIDFTTSVEYERKRLLELELPKIEKLISDKTFALRSVVSHTKETNYFKYIELIQLKREHIYKNILNNTIDNDLLENYDQQINELESDYLFVKSKMEQDTYWLYFYDLERHKILYSEVKRWYDIVLMMIARNFQKDLGSNNEVYKKIDFYRKEQTDIEIKIEDLIKLKDKVEIDYNSSKDELTLLQSKMFEIKQLMDEKVDEYTLIFLNRISFFIKDDQKTKEDKILELIDGNFYKELDNKFKEIKSYKNHIVWWNEKDKNKLFNYYSSLLKTLSDVIEEEWDIEFNHSILSNKKVEYYSYYIEKKLKSTYAKIHKFVLDEEFNKNIQNEIEKDFENIKTQFIKLIEFAFDTKQDIVFNPDIFDYDEKFIFKISEGIESKENIVLTINGFINNIKSYLSEKNLLFKKKRKNDDIMKKIDLIWNDMEKKYV